MGETNESEAKPKALTIGFAGNDNYDLLLYLAWLLKALHYRILIIDLSEVKALTAAVTGQMEDVTEETIDVMEFNALDYLPYIKDNKIRAKVCGPYLYHEKKDYDYVIVDYGRMISHPAFLGSDYQILVSDLQRHNLSIILSAEGMKEKQSYYIIRDIMQSKFRPKDLLPDKFLEQKMVSLLEFDPEDYIDRLKIQYSRQLSLIKLSGQTKKLLTSLLNLLSVPIDKKELLEVIMRSRRRRF